MKKNIRKLSESFLHAFRGLRLCIHDERNFRVHMTAAFYVILFGVFGGVSMTEAAILVSLRPYYGRGAAEYRHRASCATSRQRV